MRRPPPGIELKSLCCAGTPRSTPPPRRPPLTSPPAPRGAPRPSRTVRDVLLTSCGGTRSTSRAARSAWRRGCACDEYAPATCSRFRHTRLADSRQCVMATSPHATPIRASL
jgi:hypothetical protein